MKITKKWLKEKNACAEGVAWWKNQTETYAVAVIRALIGSGRFDWANWTITHVFTRRQNIQYAIFAAEQVIHLFEGKYPEDKRPRNAIEAARTVMGTDTPAAWTAWAAGAARDAAGAARDAAGAARDAAGAAWDAAGAAWAAGAARDAAGAAWAAGAASDAAGAAARAAGAASDAAGDALKTKIIEYGISLLEEGR